MQTIKTNFGAVILDDEDYTRLMLDNWIIVYVYNHVYIRKKGWKRKITLLKYIKGDSHLNITFKDGNKLNYMKENLVAYGTGSSMKRHRDYVEIETKIGKVKLDNDDYERLEKSGYRKIALNKDNVVIRLKESNKSMRLLSFVKRGLGGNGGVYTTFKDGDKLNFRKVNLIYGYNSSTSTSKYKGVRKCVEGGLYHVGVSYKGKDYHIGGYKEEIVAAVAYNKAMDILIGEGRHIKNDVPINGDVYREIYDILNISIKKRGTRQGSNHKLKGTTSKYTGVSLEKYKSGVCKWRPRVYYKGARLSFGNFNTELEAAQAYNEVVSELYGSDAKINPVPDPLHSIVDLEKIRQKLEKKGIKID